MPQIKLRILRYSVKCVIFESSGQLICVLWLRIFFLIPTSRGIFPYMDKYTFSIFLWSQIIHSSSLVNFRDPASAIRTGMRICFRPAQVSKNAKQLAFFSLVPSRGIFHYMDSTPFRHIRTESSCASKSFSIPRHTQSSLRVLRAHYKNPSLTSDGFL